MKSAAIQRRIIEVEVGNEKLFVTEPGLSTNPLMVKKDMFKGISSAPYAADVFLTAPNKKKGEPAKRPKCKNLL